jgi:hypothetical protein
VSIASTDLLRALVEAGERDLAEISGHRDAGAALAGEVGGDLAFRWAMLELRALLDAPPQDDTIAERYGELLDAARGDDARVAAVRGLGEQMRALQDDGKLPRSMVVRAPRRPGR